MSDTAGLVGALTNFAITYKALDAITKTTKKLGKKR